MARSLLLSVSGVLLVLCSAVGDARAQPTAPPPEAAPPPADAPPPVQPGTPPAPVVQPAPPVVQPAPPVVQPAPGRAGIACVTPQGVPVACPQVMVVSGPSVVYGPPEQPAPDPGPTSFAGFVAQRRGMQARLELGYPFLDISFEYAIGRAFTVGAGMRSLYGVTFAPWAGIRVQLSANAARTVGLALSLKGGWTYIRGETYDTDLREGLVGGKGGFGELGVSATIRRLRHGLFVNAGVRVSQASTQICDGPDYCYESGIAEDNAAYLATAFVDLGWEMRLGRNASYFLGIGVDMFVNGGDLPAMVRFRNGILIDF